MCVFKQWVRGLIRQAGNDVSEKIQSETLSGTLRLRAQGIESQKVDWQTPLVRSLFVVSPDDPRNVVPEPDPSFHVVQHGQLTPAPDSATSRVAVTYGRSAPESVIGHDARTGSTGPDHSRPVRPILMRCPIGGDGRPMFGTSILRSCFYLSPHS